MELAHTNRETVMNDGREFEVFHLSARDWGRFEPSILEFERDYFPAGLQEDPADLRNLIESPSSIVLGVRTEGVPLAAYVASDALERFGDVPGVEADPHWNHGDTHYIAVVVVASRLQHQGLATVLTHRCIDEASKHGAPRVTAHLVAGAGEKVSPGARVLRTYSNWYGTGRTFEYVELAGAHVR